MILLPRPQQHLARTQQALQASGICDILPLELAHPQPVSISVPGGVTAIIFTSQLGVHPALPKLPAACVGEATAALAESKGFSVNIIGTSNAESLSRSIIAAYRKPQHFLHPHGEKTPLEWHDLLREAGHRVTPLLAYTTQPVPKLSPSIVQVLEREETTHTVLMSVESGKHLAKLLKQANMKPQGTAICISKAVAESAKHEWPRVITAAEPSLKEIVTVLKKDLKRN